MSSNINHFTATFSCLAFEASANNGVFCCVAQEKYNTSVKEVNIYIRHEYAHQGYRQDIRAVFTRKRHLLRLAATFSNANDELIVGLRTGHNVYELAVRPL